MDSTYKKTVGYPYQKRVLGCKSDDEVAMGSDHGKEILSKEKAESSSSCIMATANFPCGSMGEEV